MKLCRLKLFGLAAAIFATATANALDTNGVISGWLSAQADLKTWEADFTQTRTLRTLKQPLVSTGHVWFAMPNQFRWELGQPAQTIAVRDAQQMLVIYPRLKRAERYPLAGDDAGMLGEALALLDAGFPRDRQTFDARFQVKALAQTNALYRLDLQPARASTRRMIPLIQLTLATNNFELLANEITLPDGSRMRNDFTNAHVNAAFASDMFTPTLGTEYKITEPMKR
jgi:outer membrane lipoprotein-sorting protein